MKSTLFILSTAFFVALSGVSAQLTLNTPINVVVCQPLQLSWAGGTAPYYLVRMVLVTYLHSGADPNGAALQDFGTQQTNAFTWTKVTFAAGTSLGLTIRDSQGLTSQTAAFTVLAGADVSCLNGGASAVSSASAGTAAPSSAGNTLTSVSSPVATSGSKTTASGSAASVASVSSARASSTNAAMASGGVSYGAAGVLGAIVAAVLA